jgi:hypothetical protein
MLSLRSPKYTGVAKSTTSAALIFATTESKSSSMMHRPSRRQIPQPSISHWRQRSRFKSIKKMVSVLPPAFTTPWHKAFIARDVRPSWFLLPDNANNRMLDLLQ